MKGKLPLHLLLKSKRKKQHLTQEEIARKMNVADTTIKYWETGRRVATNRYIIKISNAYKISTDEIKKAIHNSKQLRKEMK